MKEIRYYQKHSDCLFFNKKAFRGLCREIANDVTKHIFGTFLLRGFGEEGGRFSLESIIVLQMATEKYCSDYLAMAYIF